MRLTVAARPLGHSQGGSTRAEPWLPSRKVEWQSHRLHSQTSEPNITQVHQQQQTKNKHAQQNTMGRTVEARPLGPTQGGSTRAVPWLPAQEVEWQRHRLHKQKETNQHQDMLKTRQTGGNHKVPSVVWRVSHGGLSLGGDRIPQEVPHLGSTEVRRNHKRGLRNKESIERRKLARSQKRWKLRKDKRKSKHQGGTSRPPREAQDPGRTNIQKLSIGQDLKIATLNLRGLKQAGKREEV